MSEDKPEYGRVTGKGQVTIPKTIREALGVRYGDRVDFVERDGVVLLKKHFDEDAFDAAVAKWTGVVDLGGMTVDEYVKDMRGE
jgi:AbrB family looped-hinge helix DNA binding protein